MFKEYEKAPRNFWGDPKNQRDYLTWLSQRLGYKSMEEWYDISKDIFRANYGMQPIAISGGSLNSVGLLVLV